MADHEDIAANKVASRFLERTARVKTAGEVRFIKDRGSDDKQWGWGQPGPQNREISAEFKFDPKSLTPLAMTLRATLASMGHALSAYDSFTRIKSATVSPDGNLGGKGYIQKIPEMRRSFMNIVEALSSLSDTLYDEMKAPHWNPAISDQSPREREQVKTILTDVSEIRDDPEAWAEAEEQDMDGDGGDKPFPPPKPGGGGEGEDSPGGNDEEELAEDIMKILTCYSARYYGARGGRKKKIAVVESNAI